MRIPHFLFAITPIWLMKEHCENVNSEISAYLQYKFILILLSYFSIRKIYFIESKRFRNKKVAAQIPWSVKTNGILPFKDNKTN